MNSLKIAIAGKNVTHTGVVQDVVDTLKRAGAAVSVDWGSGGVPQGTLQLMHLKDVMIELYVSSNDTSPSVAEMTALVQGDDPTPGTWNKIVGAADSTPLATIGPNIPIPSNIHASIDDIGQTLVALGEVCGVSVLFECSPTATDADVPIDALPAISLQIGTLATHVADMAYDFGLPLSEIVREIVQEEMPNMVKVLDGIVEAQPALITTEDNMVDLLAQSYDPRKPLEPDWDALSPPQGYKARAQADAEQSPLDQLRVASLLGEALAELTAINADDLNSRWEIADKLRQAAALIYKVD